MHHLQALFEQVVQALCRWRTERVESWIRRDLGHPALVSTRPNDITLVPRVWVQPVIDGVQASERSPPAPVFSLQKDEVAKNRPLNILTSEVRLPSWAMVRRDRCPLLRRRSRHRATDRDRGLSQQKAA